jgi:lipopolysaccharide/colanic/teichoic acid biosynthesis glycosyltransferase
MKRVLDLAIAIPGLILMSPLIAIAAVAIKVDSRGPVLHRGVRVGRSGGEFRIVKLRSMASGAEHAGPAVTSAGDPRITRVGGILRRTKFDEIPQLWNVIRGDMSLVGPRPEHPDYVRRYTPEQRRLLSVRPGITSPTSLAMHDEEQILADHGGASAYAEQFMPRKLVLDLEYLDHRSLAGDLRILGRTVVFAFSRWTRGGSRGSRHQ